MGQGHRLQDVLALAKEYLTIDQWDADGGLLGLPNCDIWDLETGYSMPNFRRLPVTKQTGADPDEFQGTPSVGRAVRVSGIAS